MGLWVILDLEEREENTHDAADHTSFCGHWSRKIWPANTISSKYLLGIKEQYVVICKQIEL